ncbi:PTS mannitol transporter subunit IICBA [Clostridium estertheticum]|uniref:PTS mannitol transporter subunit IICBA n=1 Tax=Clostridium estertheticum TaxID=238834 RepID=UPI001C0AF5A7|nr:PTS mannitol transporter subunit IICBA [Clostridium estertheticum]MBU3214397.1 PTS mannitol transporter subunit IICBA [Clostridium estertheticum]WAG56382.1 PTS mannitol transporter subunit IICBA [Clostridium estertheticum]
MDNISSTEKTGKIKQGVQSFGRFLSGMVLPNIGAFIAWGIITALFIPTGRMPNAHFAKLVGPMISYLLPLLIAYTGGKMVAGVRGGVIGAIATMGVIAGADIPMFMGAMIMGPLGGYVIKKFDKLIEGKTPAGFEMLVNNFSAGIIGAILAMIALSGIGPVVLGLNAVLESGVKVIVNAGLLPLVSLFIEPGKILFLNNAINHGILSPLGLQESKAIGKSVFFLLESNPGPGLGVLLAYWAFAKGEIKASAPGAIIIHFLGGIHEIYFPYVLMNPLLLISVVCGGASGIFTFQIFGAGLTGIASPGSILAILAMTPKGGYFSVLAGVFVAAVVSFLISSVIIKRSNGKTTGNELEDAKAKSSKLKGSQKVNEIKEKNNVKVRTFNKVIFACDAGMGSSAMGATTLKTKFKKAGYNIDVVNCAIEDIPRDAQIVITHESLTARARSVVPDAEHISVKDFLNNPAFEILSARLKPVANTNTKVNIEPKNVVKNESKILEKKNIKLGLESTDKYTAIKMAGRLLYEGGYVEEEYIDAMIQREDDLSTYIGKGIAIPHGVGEAKKNIKKTGMVVLQFPNGVKFDDEVAYLVIGIAGVGDEHLQILSNIAIAIEGEDENIINMLKSTEDVQHIYDLFTIKLEE